MFDERPSSTTATIVGSGETDHRIEGSSSGGSSGGGGGAAAGPAVHENGRRQNDDNDAAPKSVGGGGGGGAGSPKLARLRARTRQLRRQGNQQIAETRASLLRRSRSVSLDDNDDENHTNNSSTRMLMRQPKTDDEEQEHTMLLLLDSVATVLVVDGTTKAADGAGTPSPTLTRTPSDVGGSENDNEDDNDVVNPDHTHPNEKVNQSYFVTPTKTSLTRVDFVAKPLSSSSSPLQPMEDLKKKKKKPKTNSTKVTTTASPSSVMLHPSMMLPVPIHPSISFVGSPCCPSDRSTALQEEEVFLETALTESDQVLCAENEVEDKCDDAGDQHRRHSHSSSTPQKENKQEHRPAPSSPKTRSRMDCFSMYNNNQQCEKLQVENVCLKQQLDLIESRNRTLHQKLTKNKVLLRQHQRKWNHSSDADENVNNGMTALSSTASTHRRRNSAIVSSSKTSCTSFRRRKSRNNQDRRRKEVVVVLLLASLLISFILWFYRSIRRTEPYHSNTIAITNNNGTTLASSFSAVEFIKRNTGIDQENDIDDTDRFGSVSMGNDGDVDCGVESSWNSKSCVRFGNDQHDDDNDAFKNDDVASQYTASAISSSSTITTETVAPFRDLALIMREGVLKQFLFCGNDCYGTKNTDVNNVNKEKEEDAINFDTFDGDNSDTEEGEDGTSNVNSCADVYVYDADGFNKETKIDYWPDNIHCQTQQFQNGIENADQNDRQDYMDDEHKKSQRTVGSLRRLHRNNDTIKRNINRLMNRFVSNSNRFCRKIVNGLKRYKINHQKMNDGNHQSERTIAGLRLYRASDHDAIKIVINRISKQVISNSKKFRSKIDNGLQQYRYNHAKKKKEDATSERTGLYLIRASDNDTIKEVMNRITKRVVSDSKKFRITIKNGLKRNENKHQGMESDAQLEQTVVDLRRWSRRYNKDTFQEFLMTRVAPIAKRFRGKIGTSLKRILDKLKIRQDHDSLGVWLLEKKGKKKHGVLATG